VRSRGGDFQRESDRLKTEVGRSSGQELVLFVSATCAYG